MTILLVAATESELKPVLEGFSRGSDAEGFTLGTLRVKCLVSGVGMVSTAFELAKELSAHRYDLAINIGIAGSFNRNLAIGQVLQITDDFFADFGAEDGPHFLSMHDLGLANNHYAPILPNISSPALEGLEKVRAITVNKVHGNELSIAATTDRLHPDLESMEGAAFFYACQQFALPSIQIRSISNYVERRNRDQWNIPLAIDQLHQFLHTFLTEIA